MPLHSDFTANFGLDGAIGTGDETNFSDNHFEQPEFLGRSKSVGIGPILDAQRYLKRVTVTFRGLIKEKYWG